MISKIIPILLFLLIGCTSHSPHTPRDISNINVVGSLKEDLEIKSVRKLYSKKMPKLIVDVYNSSNKKLKLYFSCEWSNSSNEKVGYRIRAKEIFIAPLENKKLINIARETDARKVQCSIRTKE